MYLCRFAANGTVPSDELLARAEKTAVVLLQIGGQVEALRVLAVHAANWNVDARTAILTCSLYGLRLKQHGPYRILQRDVDVRDRFLLALEMLASNVVPTESSLRRCFLTRAA